MGIIIEAMNYLFASPGLIMCMVLLCIFMYLILYAMSVLFSSSKPGINPFKRDCAKPPKPLVVDQKLRDAVIKQGFVPKRIPDKVDAIVIGSGIGGLTAANILAKAGKKVLVLEQHDQAGGCCHTFIDKGFEFDVGIHYIGEMRNNTLSKLLVQQLTEGQLEWLNLDDEMDLIGLGEPGKAKVFTWHCSAGGKEAWKKKILEKFPKEEKALDTFLFYVQDVGINMRVAIGLKTINKVLAKILINTGLIHLVTKYFKYSSRTVTEVLDEITDDEDLKAVLAYSFGDYGTLPGDASFVMHAAFFNHYIDGGSYPKGGASEFAFHMIPIIESAGGKVLVRATVSKILTNEKGRAIGVRVARTGGDIEILAPLIISDAGLVNTFTSLLPKEIAEKSTLSKLLQKRVKSGVGCMSLFVGLKGTAEELGLKAQNLWAFTGNKLHEISEQFLHGSVEEAMRSDIPLLFISFPSAKDPTFAERYPGKSACTIMTLANWEWFHEWKNERVMKRGAEYDNIKNEIGRRMWEQCLGYYPQLKGKDEFFEVGTPVTNNHYIASPKGEIYGLDHTRERFGSPDIMMDLRPETDIPGLLLTGQDIVCCGFMGAMMGGVLCASKVLNRNLWTDLVNLKKEVKKST